MERFKFILGRILTRVAQKLMDWAYFLQWKNLDKSLTSVTLQVEEKTRPDLFGWSSFKEGLASPSYTVRHDAAMKLMCWYVYEHGVPMQDDLFKAAEVLLEDFAHTSGDVSYLVGAWKDLAMAQTDDARQAAHEREEAIYGALKLKKELKN